MKPRRRKLPKLRPVECPACHKVPKCMRHPCLISERYYIVECRPYCGRTARGYTPKQAIDEWNRRIEYERRTALRPLLPCALCGIFLPEPHETLDFPRISLRIPRPSSHESPLPHTTSKGNIMRVLVT